MARAGRAAQQRDRLADELAAVDTRRVGVEFRWLGDQTDDCAAALEPSQLWNQGATERDRFLAGARHRGEPAVSLFTIAVEDDEPGRSVLFSADTSVMVDQHTTVTGRKIGAGTLPALADGLDPDDKDLANRLLHTVGRNDRWLALDLAGSELHGTDGIRTVPPDGTLVPLLVTGVGEPVVAVWQPSDKSQRVYVLPAGHDWTSTLDWLIHRCLPRHAPARLVELRRDLLPVPAEQLSVQETAANDRLAHLEQQYAADLAAARQAAQAARERADTVRDPLLHATGKHLEHAVAQALRDGGLQVEDLDQRLGATTSADLLVTGRGRRVLVEVKSTGGPAPENLPDKLTKHLAAWPATAPDEPVDRGVLIVNHQTRTAPHARAPDVYTRPEFLAALAHTVLPTTRLLAWWLQDDWDAIRNAVLGPAGPTADGPGPAPANPQPTPAAPRRPWFPRTRRSSTS